MGRRHGRLARSGQRSPILEVTDVRSFLIPVGVDPKLTPDDPLFARLERLRELGERLDSFRKQRLVEHSFLTMTGLYNALERLRELENGCDVSPGITSS